MKNKLHDQKVFHMMLVLPLSIMLVYVFMPMFGIIIAFQKFRPALGFFRSQWVGFSNFRSLFLNPAFSNALFNTLYIAGAKIILQLLVPIIFSLLLNEVRKVFVKKSIQTIVYLPHFVSWVLMAGIIIDILSPRNGIVNQLLQLLGMNSIFFLGDNRWFPIVLIGTSVWKEFGWGTIIFLAALSGVNPELYEAAIIDGAGRFKQTLYITIPGIATTVILIATLSLGNILNAGFDQVFNLLSPIVRESGDILDTLVYRIGIENAQFSMATSAGLFKSVVSFFMITTSYRLAYKFSGYKIF